MYSWRPLYYYSFQYLILVKDILSKYIVYCYYIIPLVLFNKANDENRVIGLALCNNIFNEIINYLVDIQYAALKC